MHPGEANETAQQNKHGQPQGAQLQVHVAISPRRVEVSQNAILSRLTLLDCSNRKKHHLSQK